MKKRSTKIVSVLMSLVLVFTITAVGIGNAGAVSVNDAAKMSLSSSFNAEKTLYNLSDKIIDVLVSAIAAIMPAPKWQNAKDYVSENFMKGMETFLTEPAENAKWSLGYDSESILTNDVLDGNHYVSGGIAVKPKIATEVIDDSKVRTVALNDGSGRGTVVFATLDAYGLANSDVREIRSRLASFAKENNIVSINVSVLHQHSAVDTFGMNGDIFKAVFVNPFINLINGVSNSNISVFNGKNSSFQENLYKVTAKSIKDAVRNMTTGTLKFSTVDCSQYIVDKRPPYALDQNLNRSRFIPDDGSRETWFSTSVIHCVGNGVQGTQITADYPYYMEKYINENDDANFMLLLGAELSTSQNYDTIDDEGLTRLESIAAFGEALGKRLSSVDESSETVVAPLLNIRHAETKFKIDNKIMYLAGKAGLFSNKVVLNGKDAEVVSELGYMEIGSDLAVALIPGELEASVAYGGGLTAVDSWTGTDWKYDSMQTIVGNSRKLLVFGLCNDQIGYIVPDNDYMAMLVPESKSVEFVSLGRNTASHLVEEFTKLVKNK